MCEDTFANSLVLAELSSNLFVPISIFIIFYFKVILLKNRVDTIYKLIYNDIK